MRVIELSEEKWRELSKILTSSVFDLDVLAEYEENAGKDTKDLKEFQEQITNMQMYLSDISIIK